MNKYTFFSTVGQIEINRHRESIDFINILVGTKSPLGLRLVPVAKNKIHHPQFGDFNCLVSAAVYATVLKFDRREYEISKTRYGADALTDRHRLVNTPEKRKYYRKVLKEFVHCLMHANPDILEGVLNAGVPFVSYKNIRGSLSAHKPNKPIIEALKEILDAGGPRSLDSMN